MPSGRAGQRAAASTVGRTRRGENYLELVHGFSRGRRRRERCDTPKGRAGGFSFSNGRVPEKIPLHPRELSSVYGESIYGVLLIDNNDGGSNFPRVLY